MSGNEVEGQHQEDERRQRKKKKLISTDKDTNLKRCASVQSAESPFLKVIS